MQFISFKDNKFVIEDAAAELLRNTPQQIAFVGVAGEYRRGKSTLLNKLLGRNVFGANASTESLTKGLWIAPWQSGVFLMDAEGFGCTNSGQEHDYHIFCLVVLLSSAVLYNNFGAITSQSVESLHLAGKLADHLKHSAKVSLSPSSLIWLARDFTLELGDMDAPAYLESKIGSNKGVLELFPFRSCFTFPPPTTTADGASTKASFAKSVQDLQTHLLKTVRPKECAMGGRGAGGLQLTGPTLLVLASTIVHSINHGQMLNFVPVFEALAQLKDMQARQLAQTKVVFGDPFDVLLGAMNAYEANTLEPRSTEVLQDMIRLVRANQTQHLQGLSHAKHVPNSLPPFWRDVLDPVVARARSEAATEVQSLKAEVDMTRAAMENEKKEWNERLQTEERKHKECESRLADATKSQQASQQRAAEVEATWQAKYQMASAELAQVSQELDEAQDESVQTAAQILELTSRLQRTETQLQESQRDAEHMRQTIMKELQCLRAQATDQEQALFATQQLEKEMHKQLLEAQQTVERQTRDLDSHASLMTKLEQDRSLCARQLEESQNEVRRIQILLTVAQSREEEAAKLRKRPRAEAAPTGELAWLRERHAADEKTIANLEKECAELRRKAMSLEVESLKKRQA